MNVEAVFHGGPWDGQRRAFPQYESFLTLEGIDPDRFTWDADGPIPIRRGDYEGPPARDVAAVTDQDGWGHVAYQWRGWRAPGT